MVSKRQLAHLIWRRQQMQRQRARINHLLVYLLTYPLKLKISSRRLRRE